MRLRRPQSNAVTHAIATTDEIGGVAGFAKHGDFRCGGALVEAARRQPAIGKTYTADAPFRRTWTPMIELLAARELESGAQTDWDVAPQLQVSLNKRQHVLGAIGIRQPVTDRGNRPMELVFYLLWDWVRRRVLQG